jgi:hypothetical protein
VEQGPRTSQANVSAALAAAHAALRVGTPSGNGQASMGSSSANSSFVGKSLAEMAQSDLDAALQLLADRAQYITGSTGAAIALRRRGMNDMMCRASAGANAPELGALLSTEVGLSGESVRTRQAMRCDDTEQDMRVNRDVCRQMGIASVVVMPVVHDDEVLGVFELFSGRINAFGERDLLALQRLSTMVETAVGLARAAEEFPALVQGAEPVSQAETVVAGQVQGPGVSRELGEVEDPIVEVEAAEPVTLAAAEGIAAGAVASAIVVSPVVVSPVVVSPVVPPEVVAPQVVAPQIVPPQIAAQQVVSSQSAAEKERPAGQGTRDGASAGTGSALAAAAAAAAPARQTVTPPSAAEVAADLTLSKPIPATPARPAAALIPSQPVPSQSETGQVAARKVLFWSAANAMAEQMQAEADQSHLPAVLRHLRKCEACGFPISSGRALCVDCEEKKWRGQRSGQAAKQVTAEKGPATSQPTGSVSNRLAAAQMSPPAPRAFAAAADAQAGAALVAARRGVASASQPNHASQDFSPALVKAVSTPVASAAAPSTTISDEAKPATSGVASPNATSSALPEHRAARPVELVLSAAAAPERSWLAANKFIICALVVVAGVIAAVFFLR